MASLASSNTALFKTHRVMTFSNFFLSIWSVFLQQGDDVTIHFLGLLLLYPLVYPPRVNTNGQMPFRISRSIPLYITFD